MLHINIYDYLHFNIYSVSSFMINNTYLLMQNFSLSQSFYLYRFVCYFFMLFRGCCILIYYKYVRFYYCGYKSNEKIHPIYVTFDECLRRKFESKIINLKLFALSFKILACFKSGLKNLIARYNKLI